MPSNLVTAQPATPPVPNPLSQVQQFNTQNPTAAPGSRLVSADPKVGALTRMAQQGSTVAAPPRQQNVQILDQVRQRSENITGIYQQAAQKRKALAAQQQVAPQPVTSNQPQSTGMNTGGVKPGNAPTGMTRVDSGYLRPDTAAAFNQMRAAFQAATGQRLSLTEGWRSLADTAKLHAQNPKINAAPGKSKHNYGIALDLSGMGSPGSKQFQWLLANAPKFGFSWDTGRRIGEPWHWEYIR